MSLMGFRSFRITVKAYEKVIKYKLNAYLSCDEKLELHFACVLRNLWRTSK